MSPSGRTAKVAFVAVIISALTSVGASTASAATAPPPVRAVVVRGTSTPLELTLSWTPPADAAYAGARVVVVPGATATTNPADPAAVFAQNAPAPVTSVTWSAGTAGQKYSASVFAYEATATAFAPAATAAISLPDPIKHLATEPAYGSIFAYFVLPANADAAVLCQRLDRAPTSPADATKCSAPQASGVSDWALARDAVVPLAVFSVDTRTGIYGPGVSAGDGALPPMTPSVQLWSASPARLGVVWTHSTGEVADLGGTVRSGGNVGWRILIAPGTRTPVGNPAARQITILRSAVTVENDKYGEIRRTELSVVPDLPYTVVVRGFDAEGNLSPWSSAVTGATVTPGTRLDVRGTDGGWRSSVVAGPTVSASAAVAVDPLGVTHALNGRVLMRRSAGGAWTRVQLPPRIFGMLTLAGTRSSAGTIAFADRNCVFAKPRTGSWRKVGCLTVAPNVSGQRGLGLKDVFAVEVDRFGAVHVLYSGNQADCRCASLHYATNRTGRWTVTRLRNIADRQTGEAEHSTEKGVADMTYDPVTDKV
ncbi:MAG: hypothetical protein QOG49_1407, partial [Frankiaceae bacterium]|nr:hypothetical protein [Frankiaceae bacterium]